MGEGVGTNGGDFMKKWTRTSDGLPDFEKVVVISTPGAFTITAILKMKGTRPMWKTSSGLWPLDRVVAWMPIPAFDL
jgi:hypothetical protein